MTRRGKKRLLTLIIIVAVLGAATTAAYFVREARHAQQLVEAYHDGMAAYDVGDYANALRGLGKSLSEHRDDPEVLFRIADARRHVPIENDRHVQAAIAFAREAASRDPQDKRPLELLLTLYAKTGFITEGLDVSDRLLALDLTNYDALTAKVQCLSALGKTVETRTAIEALLAAYPRDIAGHQKQIEMMRLDGTPSSKIVDHVNALVKQYPEDMNFATLRIRTLAVFGFRDDAIKAAQGAVSLEIPSSAALLELVRTLDLLGQRPLADELLDRAAKDDRFRDDVFAFLIERAWKAGQKERAREQAAAYAKALADTPTDLLGWMTLAMLPAEKGWASTETGKELAARSDDVAPIWQGLLDSRELIDREQYADARKKLNDEVLKMDGASDHSLLWSFLGEASQQLGESDMAVRSLQQAVSIDPSSSRSQMMLATSLLDLGRLDEARLSAERAVMSNPGAPEALTLARVYIALLDAGRGDARIESGAVSILEEMASQVPDQPDVQALLARTYLAVNRVPDAREVIDRMTKADQLPAPAVLLDLASACKRAAPELLDPLLALADRMGSAGAGLLAMQLDSKGEALKPEEVKAAYQSAIQAATDPAQRMQYEIAYARYIDSTSDEGALAEFKRISETHPNEVDAQQALLNSRVAWTDQDSIIAAIARLKAITGEQGSRWTLAEAQRVLAFEPGQEGAAKVVKMLGTLVQPPSPNVKALMLSSDALRMLDNRHEAIQMLIRAIEQQPDNPLLFAQTIDLLQSAGRSVEASQYLVQFMSLTSLSADMQRRRVDQLDRQDMWPEAIRDCESLVAATNDSMDRLRLAIMYSGHGRTADARRLFDQLLAEPDVATNTRIAAADFFAVADNFDKGLAILKPLEGQVDASEYTKTLGSFYERRGHLADAEALYKARAESSKSGDDWAALVEFEVRNRQIPQARESIKQGLAVAADHAALLALSNLLDSLESGKLGSDSVDGIINALVDKSLRPTMKQLAEAMQYYDANPNDTAGYIKKLRKAVDDQPALILGWQLLTSALMGDGQADNAVTAAQSAARILPGSVRSAELLATTLADAGRFDEARAAAGRWHELDPESLSRADLLLAQIEAQSGQPQRALTAIEPWVQRVKDEADTFPTRVGLYASILIQAGRVSEAHDLIWPRAQSNPDWAQMYVRLAAEIQGSPDVAIQWVDRAQPLIPLTLDSRAGLARIRLGLGQSTGRTDQYQQTVELLSPVATDASTPGPVLALLAGAYQQLGQFPQAEAAYRAALKVAPDDPIILNNLGYMLLQTGGKAQEALDLAQRANAAARSRNFPPSIRANLLDTVGTAQLQLGDIPEAQSAFREGLNLDGASAMLHLGMAEALARAGKIDDARSEYAKVASRGDLNRVDPDLNSRLERVAKLVR